MERGAMGGKPPRQQKRPQAKPLLPGALRYAGGCRMSGKARMRDRTLVRQAGPCLSRAMADIGCQGKLGITKGHMPRRSNCSFIQKKQNMILHCLNRAENVIARGGNMHARPRSCRLEHGQQTRKAKGSFQKRSCRFRRKSGAAVFYIEAYGRKSAG